MLGWVMAVILWMTFQDSYKNYYSLLEDLRCKGLLGGFLPLPETLTDTLCLPVCHHPQFLSH